MNHYILLIICVFMQSELCGSSYLGRLTGLAGRGASSLSTHALAHNYKLALLWLVTSLLEALLSLCGSSPSLGYNTTMLIHFEITLLKSTSCLVCSSIPYLSARSGELFVLLTTDVVHTISLLLMSLSHYTVNKEKNAFA